MEFLEARTDQGIVRAARFAAAHCSEWHLTIPACRDFVALAGAYEAACEIWGLASDSALTRRVFVPDWKTGREAALGAGWEGSGSAPVAVSVVEQPALPGRGWALHASHLQGAASPRRRRFGPGVELERSGVRHLFATGFASSEGDAASQTAMAFTSFARWLDRRGGVLADDAVRTWVYVADVDRDYGAVNAARGDLFSRLALSPTTHFIASTGIGGRAGPPPTVVGVDAYAIVGLAPEQRCWLHAPSNLGPASAYGATFERGVTLQYGDRRQVLLSGTAAIDPEGRTLHLRDPVRQAERTLDNVEALLLAAGVTVRDANHAIVYLREAAHHDDVARVVSARLGPVPTVFVAAAVCRPEWLVEIECAATTDCGDPRWPPF